MNVRAIQSLRDACFEAMNLGDDLKGVTYEHFEASRQLTRLTERSLEIVGEALRRASDADPGLQNSHPEFRGWILLRNVLSHQYDDVRPKELWTAVTEELPDLVDQLRDLLEPLESS